MINKLHLHDGTIRPSLVAELEAYRSPQGRVSSYYLNIDPHRWGNTEAIKIAIKDTLKEHREQIDKVDLPHAVRQSLHQDLELVSELAMMTAGERGIRSLACFVASENDYARSLRSPGPSGTGRSSKTDSSSGPCADPRPGRPLRRLPDRQGRRSPVPLPPGANRGGRRRRRSDPGPDPLPRSEPRARVHAQAHRSLPPPLRSRGRESTAAVESRSNT